MAEIKLAFNRLEVRGVHLMVQTLQGLAREAAHAASTLAAAEAEAAEIFAGRLPVGVTPHMLRIDQQTDSVFCPGPEPVPAPAPAPAPVAPPNEP